ncbi:uncharacterized protein LOC121790808 [Salvia splendens]|uniref:uncharacterized protein LOC121790808 n=1 Tax=Salvia splendens TaxID=180675 RepID=UPI001C274743|nr:uncharacterized protein LOC121790808 [Salvia splendens]
MKSLQLNPQPQAVTVMKCGLCQGGHHTDQCPSLQGPPVDDVNYIGNHHQGFNQSNQYNNQQNWRPQQATWNQAGPSNTSGTQWRYNTQPPGYENKPSVEDQLGQILSFMTKSQKENDYFKEKTVEKFGQLEATMRNLETQIGQIATASHTRIPNAIPSDTVPNPKGFEQCKAVKLRSGKDLESPIMLDAQNGSTSCTQGGQDLIAKKEKIQDDGVVILSAFCSQFVKGKMPAKRRDPGSCVIPCEMGDKKFPKCLLDQGSGISLMALKTARSIGLEARIEPIDIDLQLADHSIVKPKEMEEDKDMPILFGRPFLATGDVVIETKTNTVMFRVDGENVVIKQEKAGKRLL